MTVVSGLFRTTLVDFDICVKPEDGVGFRVEWVQGRMSTTLNSQLEMTWCSAVPSDLSASAS